MAQRGDNAEMGQVKGRRCSKARTSVLVVKVKLKVKVKVTVKVKRMKVKMKMMMKKMAAVELIMPQGVSTRALPDYKELFLLPALCL